MGKEMKADCAARFGGISTQMESKLQQINTAKEQFEAVVQTLWGEFSVVYEQLQPAQQVISALCA